MAPPPLAPEFVVGPLAEPGVFMVVVPRVSVEVVGFAMPEFMLEPVFEVFTAPALEGREDMELFPPEFDPKVAVALPLELEPQVGALSLAGPGMYSELEGGAVAGWAGLVGDDPARSTLSTWQ